MTRSINDLSEKEFSKLELDMKRFFFIDAKALHMLSEKYSVDANEIFSWYMMLFEQYAGQDLNKKSGLTVNEGMKLIKNLFKKYEKENTQ